jgi:hypothetical protein
MILALRKILHCENLWNRVDSNPELCYNDKTCCRPPVLPSGDSGPAGSRSGAVTSSWTGLILRSFALPPTILHFINLIRICLYVQNFIRRHIYKNKRCSVF